MMNMDLTSSLSRNDSASCLLLLDCESDTFHVYDPPAWKPGRYLQFADITSVEDEASVRPVSLHTDRLQSLGCGDGSDERGVTSSQDVRLDLVQMGSSRQFWSRPRSRRTTVLLTACISVGLTALGLLSFVI